MKDIKDKIDKQIWVKGILVDCPLGRSLSDCPANDLRTLPLEELVKSVNKMTEPQLEMMIKYHNCCMVERLKKQI